MGMSDTENNIIVFKRISMNTEYTKRKLSKASCNTSLSQIQQIIKEIYKLEIKQRRTIKLSEGTNKQTNKQKQKQKQNQSNKQQQENPACIARLRG